MNEENFLQFILNAPEQQKPEMINPNLSYFETESFKTTLTLIDRMTEHDIFNFIKSNIDRICDLIVNNDPTISGVLTSAKFLTEFSRVISTMPITYIKRVAVNKICYDYLTSDLNDPEIKRIALDATKIVNNDIIQQLVSIGLDQNTAVNLALCRYSSMTEKVNIKRLNFTICYKDPDMMTEQTIIWIYEKLFDSIGELFRTTMLESYFPSDNVENEESFMEIFSTIALAILTIVNNMSTSDIAKVIRSYVQDWEYANRPHVRISLRSLSADFGRIQYVVELLNQQGVFVP